MTKLPSANKMYEALAKRDTAFEGIFIVGVRTTGIFCRPGCTARTPKRENVEFFPGARAALARGYRPCKICKPMALKGATPEWMQKLLIEIAREPGTRWNDARIRATGLDPNRVRRWFKKTHGMTFQGYLRSLRLGKAFGRIDKGGKVIDTAFTHGYESLSGFTDAFKKLTGLSPKASVGKDVIHMYQILTPLGPMLAGTVKEGVCMLEFTDRRGLERQLARMQRKFGAPIVTSEGPYLKELRRQITEYFEGKRRVFDLPLAVPASDFQKSVWDQLREIPFGKTRSYRDQAIAIGNPKAVRAVARANGDNRIAIVIPCHRVIGANGELVGYAGGIWRKQYLLDLERGK